MKTSEGVGLGKLFGINIRIDISWFFIFFLLTWNLSAGVLPAIHPDWSVALNWTVGAFASLLFFASVLAHELAHSLVAKARGLEVKNITLFIFGGVSNMEREPPTPKSEFLITIAGPLTSFALGIFFIILGQVGVSNMQALANNRMQFLGGLGPVATMLLWVGPVNILVGFFNLVPGFPLDGGRIVRSVIWSITGNLVKATLWASSMGQVVAWFFMFVGVAMVFGVEFTVFGTGVIGGLWIAFIGWFLNMAAQQSYHQTVVMNLLKGVQVKDIMKEAPNIPEGLSVADSVRKYFMSYNQNAVMVGSKGGKTSVLTVDDVREIPREAWEVAPVGLAARSFKRDDAISFDESADNLLTKIISENLKQVPVVGNGDFIGFVGKKEIKKWLELNLGKNSES